MDSHAENPDKIRVTIPGQSYGFSPKMALGTPKNLRPPECPQDNPWTILREILGKSMRESVDEALCISFSLFWAFVENF